MQNQIVPLLLWLGQWLTFDPQVLIPRREDDDCTVWSVTRQNREPPSKRAAVSLPLTSLSGNTATICPFYLWTSPVCLRAVEEPEC